MATLVIIKPKNDLYVVDFLKSQSSAKLMLKFDLIPAVTKISKTILIIDSFANPSKTSFGTIAPPSINVIIAKRKVVVGFVISVYNAPNSKIITPITK